MWAIEGVNVTITAPTGHVLTVPLRVVVCGDVQSVQDASLRDRNGTMVSGLCPSVSLSVSPANVDTALLYITSITCSGEGYPNEILFNLNLDSSFFSVSRCSKRK